MGEPNQVGAMLGSYRIVGELSRGGMGAVYRAEHAVLGRPVAIKLLRPELTTNHELVTRFLNEARAASAIRHPGIIEVIDFGVVDDGRAYFVMELLQGETLARRIATHARLPAHDAARIAHGIASALTAAHGTGIVHRDLKPDNVFLVSDPVHGERPKLLDFGIAKLGEGVPDTTRFTQAGALIGTPFYMAPEQARSASGIDHRADLYSLGCMLYEMLVGEPPFNAVGAGELIAMHLFSNVVPPGQRVAGLAPALDAIVMKLLEKEPEARFQGAGEVALVLARYLGDEGPRRATPVATRPASSRGFIVGMITALFIAAAVVAVVLARDHATATPDPPQKRHDAG